jgi:hypothetical protein
MSYLYGYEQALDKLRVAAGVVAAKCAEESESEQVMLENEDDAACAA